MNIIPPQPNEKKMSSCFAGKDIQGYTDCSKVATQKVYAKNV